MNRVFFHGRKWEELRHMIGGGILLALIFFSYAIPTVVTLLMMLFVSWMAIVSFSGFRVFLVVSIGSFLLRLCDLAFWRGKMYGGVILNWTEILEISLQTSVLFTMIFGAAVWVRRILRAKKAGFDEVLGAVNLYIWIAIIYACLYTLISRVQPGAFHLVTQLVTGMGGAGLQHNFNELFYFSFVTQTTLGYGDIVPVGHLARSLAISQAIIGQFYVAIVLTYVLNLWIRDLGKQVTKLPPAGHK